MFVISLGGMSELVLLELVERLRPYYTLKLKACQRLIVGWNLEYCQVAQQPSPKNRTVAMVTADSLDPNDGMLDDSAFDRRRFRRGGRRGVRILVVIERA
jgi:hypothetical protein